MLEHNRNLFNKRVFFTLSAILTAATLVGLLVFSNPEESTPPSKSNTVVQQVPEKVTNPQIDAEQKSPPAEPSATLTPPKKKVLFGLEPYKDEEVLQVFDDYLNRIKAFDETLSSQEVLEFEQRMTLSVEFSEYAAETMEQRLDTALESIDPQQIYLLERVFAGGDESPKRLISSYMKIIDSGNQEVHDYALQGIENYKEHASTLERHAALEEAFKQAQNYQGTDKVLPAVTAIRNLSRMEDISPLYKPIGINVLKDVHKATNDGRQKFYVQKALLRLSESDQAQNLALEFVSTDPSKDSILSVMEAITMKDVELDITLGQELNNALNRSNVTEQELKMAKEIGLL